MAFPTRLLAPGERVYLDSRPHWYLLAGPSAVVVGVIVATVVVVIEWGSAPLYVGWVLAAFCVAALAWYGARYLAFRSTSFVVTSQRVIYRTGVLRRSGREIPIGRVQDVTYHQGLFQRVVHAGSLTIESAGARGQEPFLDIRRPEEVQALLNRAVTDAAGVPGSYQATAPRGEPGRSVPSAPERGYTPHSTQTPPAGQPAVGFPQAGSSLGEQLEELSDLHRHGVITDAEFEQKRQEILDRY